MAAYCCAFYSGLNRIKICPKCGARTLKNYKRYYRGYGVESEWGDTVPTAAHVYDAYRCFYCAVCDENFSAIDEEKIVADGERILAKTRKELLKETMIWSKNCDKYR